MKNHTITQNAALACGLLAVLTGVVLQASSGIGHPSHSLDRDWNLKGAMAHESSQEHHQGCITQFSHWGCRTFGSIYARTLKLSIAAIFTSERSAPSIPLLFPVPSKVNHALD